MDAFSRLNRSLREYIYQSGWQELRPIQKKAITFAQESTNNFVIAAPTASGKTEAAFLPAMNSIEDWDTGVRIVYISPLIALINDQFKRLMSLCSEMGITVTSWHGEANSSKKKKLLKKDRKSTRLNSSHVSISYAVFCLKKKKRESLTR